MAQHATGTCPWALGTPEMRRYHDKEWGRPCTDDPKLFEMLVLEGMQAGLSWQCVLGKREAMRQAFDGFNVDRILAWGPGKIDELMGNPGIIRNRRKLEAVYANAVAFRNVQREFGSFSAYFWAFVDGAPLVNAFVTPQDVPAATPLAQQVSKDLKKRGFKFVGPTIVYSLMQSVGLVDDHLVTCPCHTNNRR